MIWVAGLAVVLSVAAGFAWVGTAFAQADTPAAGSAAAAAVKVDTVTEGHGPFALPDDTVAVIYTGKLLDGTVFDSNAGKAPLVFRLDQVIPGWQQGLQKMRAGGRATLHIPAALGYGANGAPPTIPPNADLVFDVQLIAIKPR